MEDKELQKIWKTFDTKINRKSKDELRLLLKSKAKQTLNKFRAIIGVSVASSAGLIVFLIIASVNRQDDLIFLINNVTLGLLTIISFSISILSWYKLKNSEYNLALKDWLEERINLLSYWLTGRYSKLYLFVIPILYILIVLSIHVYFESKSFIEVLNTEESMMGLVVSIPVGLFVSYYVISKIRRYQLNNLNFLKDLYGRLCKMD